MSEVLSVSEDEGVGVEEATPVVGGGHADGERGDPSIDVTNVPPNPSAER